VPKTPEEVPGLDDGSAAAVLDAAEEIVNAIGLEIVNQSTENKRRWWKRKK
jgi:hypothetical protein